MGPLFLCVSLRNISVLEGGKNISTQISFSNSKVQTVYILADAHSCRRNAPVICKYELYQLFTLRTDPLTLGKTSSTVRCSQAVTLRCGPVVGGAWETLVSVYASGSQLSQLDRVPQITSRWHALGWYVRWLLLPAHGTQLWLWVSFPSSVINSATGNLRSDMAAVFIPRKSAVATNQDLLP